MERETIREFVRHYRKAAKAFDGFSGTKIRVSFKRGKGTIESEFPQEEILIRIAVLMRRFLDPKSDQYFKRFWVKFRSAFNDVLSATELSQINTLMQNARRNGPSIVVGKETYTAERIYQLISAGELYVNDELAAAELQRLMQEPVLRHLFWHQFLSYTIAVFEALSILQNIIKREHLHRQSRRSGDVDRCIYCLSGDGGFESEDHILSESAGNEKLVLPPGVVCDQCNNTILSKLDQYFCESPPIAALRVLYVPYTKQGRLPRVNLQNVEFEKRRPGVFRIHAKDRTGEPRNHGRDDNGMMKLTSDFRGRFDGVRFARALYKIGLGLVAHDQGAQRALESRFNAARAFIRGEGTCPNRIMMATTCVPEPRVHCVHQSFDVGTVVILVYCGLPFILNLETEPVVRLSEIPAEFADRFQFKDLLEIAA